MRLRKPTKVQKWMIVLLGLAFLLIGVFAVPEIMGIMDPALEDTFSEWVWDLPLPVVIPIAIVFFGVGGITTWAGIHFIEGHVSRRGRKFDDEREGHENPPIR